MSLASDLKRLEKLAYHRLEKSGTLVRRFHARPKAGRNEERLNLDNLYKWLFVPLTLWTIDVDALLEMVLGYVEQKKPFTTDMLILLEMLPPVPEARIQSVVAEHEHEVATGRYESLINAEYKFDAMERELSENPRFVAQWQEITRRFKTETFADHKGVIRRRMVSERNFRENLAFRWKSARDRFREIFDAFCQRWHLYGMQGDRPLLLKLSVNVTPYGTMIMIPGFWSFDHKRDIKWSAVTKLHRVHGATKQGPKSTQSRLAQQKEIQMAKILWNKAVESNLTGAARYEFVKSGLKWDLRTDDRKVRKIIQQGRS